MSSNEFQSKRGLDPNEIGFIVNNRQMKYLTTSNQGFFFCNIKIEKLVKLGFQQSTILI